MSLGSAGINKKCNNFWNFAWSFWIFYDISFIFILCIFVLFFGGGFFFAYKNEKRLYTTSACILFVLVVVLLPQIGFSSRYLLLRIYQAKMSWTIRIWQKNEDLRYPKPVFRVPKYSTSYIAMQQCTIAQGAGQF